MVGTVIAYIAVQTGSLLPGILFHFTHNSLAVLGSRMTPEIYADYPFFAWIYRSVDQSGYEFHWQLTALAFIVAIGLLYWFRHLPFQASEEEKLQQALDHQTARVPVK